MKLPTQAALIAVAAAMALFNFSAAARAGGPAVCGAGWIFFDLGNTLVDTTDFDHLKYMPGARDYLRSLTAAGFHLALISNVPDTWGPGLDAKLTHLKAVINGSWSEAEPFNWSDFETVLLPPSDSLRKPAPYLFQQARQLESNCPIAYEGEEAIEVNAATAAGFDRGYVVGKTQPEGFYPTAARIFQSP